ncbi:MAG: hypothetical protein ABI977_12655, partial [Acidobacteriota bacterium]
RFYCRHYIYRYIRTKLHPVRDLLEGQQVIQETAGAARSWVTLYDGYGRKCKIKYAQSTENATFDRAYIYDNVGRVEKAFTSYQATSFDMYGTQPTPPGQYASDPYWQSFKYNEWGQIKERSGKFWSIPDNSGTINYQISTGRHDGWDYDGSGNLTNDDTNIYEYDAAGRSSNVKAIGQNDSSRGWFDEDGLLVKENPYVNKHEYLIRSSVLGGKVVATINGGDPTNNSCGYAPVGAKCVGNVYAGGRLLASQRTEFGASNGIPTGSFLAWVHVKPIAGTESITSTSSYTSGPFYSYYRTAETDPAGINVGFWDPTVQPTISPDYEVPAYASTSSNGVPSSTLILVNGLPMDANLAHSLLRSGAAEIDWNSIDRLAATQLGIFGHWEADEGEDKNNKWKLVDDPYNPGEKIVSFENSTKDRFVIDSFGSTPSFGNFQRQGGGQQSQTSTPQKNCATPNSLINDPEHRKLYESLWDRTMGSGEENGAATFYEAATNTYHKVTLSEGEHEKQLSSDRQRVITEIPTMPKAKREMEGALEKFAAEKRNVLFMAFYHTHPNYRSGGSSPGEPSGAFGDVGVQRNFRSPLGIIRNGDGYSFYMGFSTFRSDDPRANTCIWELIKQERQWVQSIKK